MKTKKDKTSVSSDEEREELESKDKRYFYRKDNIKNKEDFINLGVTDGVYFENLYHVINQLNDEILYKFNRYEEIQQLVESPKAITGSDVRKVQEDFHDNYDIVDLMSCILKMTESYETNRTRLSILLNKRNYELNNKNKSIKKGEKHLQHLEDDKIIFVHSMQFALDFIEAHKKFRKNLNDCGDKKYIDNVLRNYVSSENNRRKISKKLSTVDR